MPEVDEEAREALLAAVQEDWRKAELGAVERGLCAYAEKLTHRPAEMTAGDVEVLRDLGLDDLHIHDAVQVIAYFNYINRVADAVHVDLEPGMDPYPERIESGPRE